MLWRDGSLSTFSGSLDQFDIVWPLSQDRINGTGPDRDDLEQAAHFNHLFDSTIRIEQYLQNRIGSDLETFGTYTAPTIPVSSFLLSYRSETKQLTGDLSTVDSWEWSYTVPAIFGNTPFTDFRFSIFPSTTLLLPGSGGFQGRQELGGSASDHLGVLTSLPELYTTIEPTSARGFKLKVTAVGMSENAGLLGYFRDPCTLPDGITFSEINGKWIKNLGLTNPFFYYYWQYTRPYMYVWSQGTRFDITGNNAIHSGAIYPYTGSISDDQSSQGWLIFGGYYDADWYGWRPSPSTWHVARAGLMVRFNQSGSNGSYSFYGLAFESVMNQATRLLDSRTMKLIKAIDVDPITDVPDDTHPIEDIGGITVLDSADFQDSFWMSVNANTLSFMSSHPNDFYPVYYTLHVTGSTVSVIREVREMDGTTVIAGSRAVILQVTDTDIADGSAGIFCLGSKMDAEHEPSGEPPRRGIWFGDVIVKSEGGTNKPAARISLLYAKTGDGNLTKSP